MYLPVTALIFIAMLTVGAVATSAGTASSPDLPNDDSVQTLALQWFEEMQSGQIDREQLAPGYSAQLTDDVVKKTAQYLKDHAYGARPAGTQILLTRMIGDQKFYVVKIVFPRGDAASLMLGLDGTGKITGISLMSMAGD
jgi:hypothetical protein